jgi:pyruvate dehydrogenase E2 component (dihydrolipoamide acetyltransferase)
LTKNLFFRIRFYLKRMQCLARTSKVLTVQKTLLKYSRASSLTRSFQKSHSSSNASNQKNFNGSIALNSNKQTLFGQSLLVNLNRMQKCFYASYPDHTTIGLPALSPTMEAGTLASWAKAEGDQIQEGDLIAEIETDKATMGLEAADEGYLAKILVPAGTKDIPLKTALCIIVPNKIDIAAFANFKASDAVVAVKAPAPAASTPPPPPPTAPTAAAPAPPKQEQPKPTHTPPPTTAAPAAKKIDGARVFATPLARKLAAERNIDISLIQGTGPDQQIRAADVSSYVVSSPAVAKQAIQAQTQSFDDLTINNFRAVTAKRLLQSKQTIPHYYLTIDFDLENALKVRKDLNEQLAKDNMKISINDLVIKAAALACKKVPEANSAWMDTFIRKYNNVDINVAVATDNGLITPIVFGADKKGLTSISFDVTSLAGKARANKLQPHEFQGGTFTVSNLGMFGIKQFCAVINPPQSCILAVGGPQKRVVPDGSNGTKVATYLSVTLSCDHRVVDGAVGAKWLEHFKKFMENPASMLL